MSENNRPTSQKQMDANRRNAQRSTGPTSGEGKARSSRNAEKHSAYSDDAVFIDSGPFGQARHEVLARREEFLDELGCSGALETHLGSEMWIALEKLELTDVYANASAEGLIAGHPFIAATQADLRTAEQAEIYWEGLRSLVAARADGTLDDWALAEGSVDWENYAEILKVALVPDAHVPGIWDDDNTPADEATWREVLEALLDKVFPDPQLAQFALAGFVGQARGDYELKERELKSLVAPLLLRAESDVERPQSHLWRRYALAARDLDRVQSQRLARSHG